MPNPNPSLNERLLEKLGWRKDPASPGYWIPPAADLPPKGVVYRCPDLLSYAGMGVVLEGMRGRGWLCEMLQCTGCFPEDRSREGWRVEFRRLQDDAHARGVAPDLPAAVAEAALLALEGEGK
jgi:hypothetical protein